MTLDAAALTLLITAVAPYAPGPVGVGAWVGIVVAALVAIAATGGYRARAIGAPGAAIVRAGLLMVVMLGWQVAAMEPQPQAMRFALVALAAGAMAVRAGRWGADWLDRRIATVTGSVSTAIVVGSRAQYEAVLAAETSHGSRDHEIIGWVAPGGHRPAGALGTLVSLADVMHEREVETVFVGGALRPDRLQRISDACAAAGCELLYPTHAVSPVGIQPRLVWRHARPYFELGTPVLPLGADAAKRALDVLGATLGLVLLAPVLLLIATAIKVDSRGPVLFTQRRAGLGGRCFRMLKFRTMRHGADAEKDHFAHLNLTGDPRLFKIPDDPRVTRFGRFLRRWSLDELPQLWNVLHGDMSLVGPRPFFERDFAVYEEHHFHRLGAKPGITGLWQVSGRSEIINFEEVVRLDREYIETWSLSLDVSILLRTVPAVLSRTGAY
ncbi:MAG TPA: exopolysaccharide biosynthesis polyprenyl glycosylphosphotransferase [Gemmatimonadales bacterium]